MRQTTPKQINADFAYNVGKDIANLENEVENLKKNIGKPQTGNLEFDDKRIAIGNTVYRKLKESLTMFATGIMGNTHWLGDRPDDGIWQDPFTNEYYDRTGTTDTKVQLESFNMFEFQNYITKFDISVVREFIKDNKHKATIKVELEAAITKAYKPDTYPILRLVISNLDYDFSVSYSEQSDTFKPTILQNYEFEIDVPKDGIVTAKITEYHNGITIHSIDKKFDFINIDDLIKKSKINFSGVVEKYSLDYDKNIFFILSPSVENNKPEISSNFLLNLLEYRLNGKVATSLSYDWATSSSYIFKADTMEQLQGEIEVWYKGERIK